MKTIFTLLALVATTSLFAQFLPNYNFTDTLYANCPFDTTEQITLIEDWIIYQTLDDRWDGPIDSSTCVDVFPGPFNSTLSFNLNDIDTEKPFFFRCLLDDENKIQLEPNFIYEIATKFSFSNLLDLGTDCENGLCTGLILELEVPDSSGTGTNAWDYYSTLEEGTSSICFVAERFDSSYVTEFVLKYTFADASDPGNEWWINRVDFFPYHEGSLITDDATLSEAYWNGTQYTVPIEEIYGATFGYEYVVAFPDSVYPSPDQMHYVELLPSENADTAKPIELFVWELASLYFQRYTGMRGGLLAGSDSLRHPLTITVTNNFCIGFIEVAFTDNTHLQHLGGNISFGEHNACLLFKDGGSLKIASQTLLQYGVDRNGMLGLGAGGTISFYEGSELLIENTMVLLGQGNRPDEQIYIDLPQGAKLSFGENAHLIRASGAAAPQRLNVYMNGGTLDDHHLSPDERTLINRIYPTPEVKPGETITITPNPLQHRLAFQLPPSAQAGPIYGRILNYQGQLLYQFQTEVDEEGIAPAIDLSDWSTGYYFLELSTADGHWVSSFIKH